MEHEAIDEAFVPMFAHIEALMSIPEESMEDHDAGFRLLLDELTADMPVELDIKVGDDGKIILGSTPPVYYGNTSLLPVFHQLRVTITSEKNMSDGTSK